MDTINMLINLMGPDSANAVVAGTVITTIASLLVKLGEAIAPRTPTLKDDNAIKVVGKMVRWLVLFVSIARKIPKEDKNAGSR